jgi:hypothetical protein
MGFHGVTLGNFAPPECIAHPVGNLGGCDAALLLRHQERSPLDRPAGLDCRDDQEAKNQAVIIAGQIAADAPETSAARHVAILDSERKEIGKVSVKQADQQRTIESAVQALRHAHATEAEK